MKKNEESARSPQLTGGEGFTYEDVIAAYFLAALLREEAALAQPGLVTRVAVQQDRQSEPMDDVIVDSAAGERYRLSLQVKRSVTVSASNADFQNIITKAVETRAKPDFRPGLDRYGFIARAVGDDRLQSLERIITRAKASVTGAEFDARFRPGGESSKDDIALRNELTGLIKPVDGPCCTDRSLGGEDWTVYQGPVSDHPGQLPCHSKPTKTAVITSRSSGTE